MPSTALVRARSQTLDPPLAVAFPAEASWPRRGLSSASGSDRANAQDTAPPAVDWLDGAWLLRMRLGSLVGQIVTIATVHLGFGIALPVVPLGALIALGLATTLGAGLWLRHPAGAPPQLLPALMVHDVLHLTALLYLTGGPLNPFSFLYLVLIALSAISMSPRFTWGLAALSAACSALLFLGSWPLPISHAEQMRLHLPGMWVAFIVAAVFIVYFLMRVTHALHARERELEAARNLALRRERLASLATLAAGAAHELGSPLSTIAVVAKDLLRQPPSNAAAMRTELELISASVARCRHVLSQLATDSGQSPGESLSRFRVGDWVREACVGLSQPTASAIQASVPEDLATLPLFGPRRALGQALSALLKNAQDASSPSRAAICLTVERRSEQLWLRVQDHGSGMDAATLRHVGEPFFTTKPPGRGMGLGLFLCREVIESMGGELQIQSAPGLGTCVSLRIPIPETPDKNPGAGLGEPR